MKKEEGCPADVVAFVEESCSQYTPHDVFVMDICLCGDEYFIVECGCMNGAGFYKANIENIVTNVTEYFFDNDLNVSIPENNLMLRLLYLQRMSIFGLSSIYISAKKEMVRHIRWR